MGSPHLNPWILFIPVATTALTMSNCARVGAPSGSNGQVSWLSRSIYEAVKCLFYNKGCLMGVCMSCGHVPILYPPLYIHPHACSQTSGSLVFQCALSQVPGQPVELFTIAPESIHILSVNHPLHQQRNKNSKKK